MPKIFRRPARLSLVLLAVAFLLIFLHYSKILLPVESIFTRVFSPIQSRVYAVGVKINNFYNLTRFQKDLLKTNLELEEKVKELTIKNSQLKTELAECGSLTEQLDFLTETRLEAINAKVVGRNMQPELQTLILNRGEKDGVSVGMPVVAQQGIIVGKVAEVRRSSCQVILIDDSHSSLAASVQNANQTKGVVVGDRGLSLKMELIPQDEPIVAGDTVITSGLEANVPRGLIIGQVEQVISQPNSFFQQATLKPLISFDNLLIVSILKNIDND